MLCPNCLRQVEKFEKSYAGSGAAILTCPACNETVPIRYQDDYERIPSIAFSVVGLRGHGKTVFFSSLLHEFDRLTRRLPGFSYSALDETGLKVVREAQTSLDRGALPRPTPGSIFPRPVILQVEGLPGEDEFRLLVFDITGEVFEDVARLQKYGGYITRSRSTVWLISPSVLESSNQLRSLDDFVTRYLQAARELDGQPIKQDLLIVLTMGDRFVDENGVPEEIRQFLRGETLVDRSIGSESLHRQSHAIENWLSRKPGFHNALRIVRKEFGRVQFCVISALGWEPHGSEQAVSVTPRGVLLPLHWLLAFERERREVEAEVLRLQGDVDHFKPMIGRALGGTVTRRLESLAATARGFVDDASWSEAQRSTREGRAELDEAIARARARNTLRYILVAATVSLVLAVAGWLGWLEWSRAQQKSSAFIAANLVELMSNGGVLELPPGEYKLLSRVVLRKPLTLKGSTAGQTRIISVEGSAGLTFAGDGTFAASDVAFEYSGSSPANVLTVEFGQVNFERCRITGGRKGPALMVGNGVQFAGRSTGRLADCEFVGNALHGVAIGEQAQVELVSAVSQRNQGAGIAFGGSAGGTVTNAKTLENGTDGIVVRDDAKPVLDGGTSSGNGESGVDIGGASTSTVQGLTCSENKLNGIDIEGKAAPTLTSNVCLSNKGAGVMYADSAAGQARANRCSSNGLAGIAITKRAHPQLDANECSGNGGSGMSFAGESAGTAASNVCTKNRRSGIYLDGSARPRLQENTCSENDESGIRYADRARGTAVGNTISRNVLDGILVRQNAQPVLEGNRCTENKGSGIAYQGKAGGTARKNECTKNKGHGIVVAGEAAPLFEGNTLTDNGLANLEDWREPIEAEPDDVQSLPMLPPADFKLPQSPR